MGLQHMAALNDMRKHPRAFDGIVLIRCDMDAAVVGLNRDLASGSIRSSLFVRFLVFDEQTGDSLFVREISEKPISTSSLTAVYLPRSARLLCCQSFSRCQFLSAVSFESCSKLKRIEKEAVVHCRLKSITISRSVEYIDHAAFGTVVDSPVAVVARNLHFTALSNMLLDYVMKRAIRYFGSASHLIVPRHVETVCSCCFSFCQSLSSVSFQNDSKLKEIGAYAFSFFRLASVTLPRSLTVLCLQCFAFCPSLSSVSFGPNCQLRRMELYMFFSVAIEVYHNSSKC
jgi:hypothetical protein